MGRRAIGLALVMIGAFALAAALTVRLVLAPTLVRLPLDQTAVVTVSDENATFLDMKTLEERHGPVTATLAVQGNPTAKDASDDVAVWVSGTTVTSDGNLVIPTTETVNCLDRRTAAAVRCDAASVDGEATRIEGLTLTFPIGTEARDYEMWNGNVGAAVTARYAGEDDVDGVHVYRFEQDIPETAVDRMEGVPGSLAGGSAAETVAADVVYSNHRAFLVEPVSGKIVSASERPVTVLRGPDGATGATVLAATLAPSPAALRTAAAEAADMRDQITLIRSVLPWSAAGLGLVLVIGGAALAVSSARRRAGGESAAGAPPFAVPAAS